MPSTYVNDLRLEEIATGEQSGTWGVTTNTNLELVAEAFAYATVDPFDTDADKTETMADGSTDPIRSLYLKVTSSATLTATRTLTLAPNTVSKVWIIENATTGSQSISISQGSGANVTIPNGDVKVIYTDGAGATAAVTDAFTNLKVTDPAQTNITSVGTLSALTVTGEITANGGIALGDNDKATFGDSDDLEIYHDGSNSYIVDNGTGDLLIRAENNLYLKRTNQDETYLSGLVNDAVTLYHNNNPKIATTIGGIDVTGAVVADGLTVDTNTLYVDSSNNRVGIGTTSPASILDITLSGGGKFRVDNFGASAKIGVDTAGKALAIDGTDSLRFLTGTAGSQAERLRIDSSGNVGIGTTTVDANLQVGALNTTGSNRGAVSIKTATSDATIGESAIYIEETTGAEGYYLGVDVNGGMFFSNSGASTPTFYLGDDDNVGIGTTSPGTKLQVTNGADADLIILAYGADSTSEYMALGVNNGGGVLTAGATGVQSTNMVFKTASSGTEAEAMRIDSSGNVGIGLTNPDCHLEVKGSGNGSVSEHLRISSTDTESKLAFLNTTATGAIALTSGDMRFLTSGANTERMRIDSSGNVGIGTSSPSSYLATKLVLSCGDEDGMTLAATASSHKQNIYFADGTSGSARNRGNISYDHNLDQLSMGTASGALRFVMDSSGNVGIGTSSPAYKLHVVPADNDGIIIDSSSDSHTGFLYFGDATSNTVGAISYDHFSDAMRFKVNAAERMRIDSSGNVGIGTSSPNRRLVVSGDISSQAISAIQNTHVGGYSAIELRNNSGTQTGAIGYANGSAAITAGNTYMYSTSNITFLAGGTSERMRIGSSGNVLFGVTSAPSGVVGGSGFIPLGDDRSRLDMASTTTGSATLQVFVNPNGQVGSISTNGSATAFNTSSDYRLKENVVEMTGALDRVAQLKPARFNFIADADTTVDGFLAHEVQDIVPEAITGVKDEMQEEEYEVTPAVLDEDGNVVTEAVMGTREVPKYQGIDQSKLVPLLTKAIQEQQTLIEQLQAEVALLKGE